MIFFNDKTLFIIEDNFFLTIRNMKRTLKQSQLENMISECVGQVLAESRQPRRQTMNEAQMSQYIQNIINEELENEGGFGDKWK